MKLMESTNVSWNKSSQHLTWACVPPWPGLWESAISWPSMRARVRVGLALGSATKPCRMPAWRPSSSEWSNSPKMASRYPVRLSRLNPDCSPVTFSSLNVLPFLSSLTDSSSSIQTSSSVLSFPLELLQVVQNLDKINYVWIRLLLHLTNTFHFSQFAFSYICKVTHE